MAALGVYHCATSSRGTLHARRSPSKLTQSSVRLSPQTSAHGRTVRPLKRRCTVVSCEQSNGAAPEASVTCLGEALFGMMTQLCDRISRPGHLNLLVLSRLTDCLAEERGVPKEQVKTWIPYPGGAPANVAAALGRLGVKVSFVSAVGQDDLGEHMLELLSCKQTHVSALTGVLLLNVRTLYASCSATCGFDTSAEGTTAYQGCFGYPRSQWGARVLRIWCCQEQ